VKANRKARKLQYIRFINKFGKYIDRSVISRKIIRSWAMSPTCWVILETVERRCQLYAQALEIAYNTNITATPGMRQAIAELNPEFKQYLNP
jgi:hypothetical protein